MKALSKILFILSTFSISAQAESSFSEDYYKLDIAKQKEYFFDFFSKRINIENEKILEERAFIKSLNRNTNLDPNSEEYKRLVKLQKKYKISKTYNYDKFLKRIDVVPTSLALSQAATESGWGKSRFFKKANNIFGHWTYNAKIGMLPLKRDAGKKHFIRKFPSLQASIAAYMLNLNRTGAYKEFRTKREEMRMSKKLIDGMQLSSTMTRYSGIGHDYLKILKSIIKRNNLISYDLRFQKLMSTN